MKRLAALGATAVMLLAIAAPAAAKPTEKVWVCHATNSETNPWVLINISEAAWVNGHSNEGPALHQNIDKLIKAYPGIHAGPAAPGDCEDVFPN